MLSNTAKRIIRGAIGVLYAVVYGFWTMLATGGCHANFVWLFLFAFVEFFGLYFPIMAVLAVDLRSRTAKIVFGSLIVFNLAASFALIGSWVSGASGNSLDDFSKTWKLVGPAPILFRTVAHFLPTIFFAFQLIKAMHVGLDSPGDDPIVPLGSE